MVDITEEDVIEFIKDFEPDDYSCHSVFNKKNINTFDVLTFKVCSNENKFWQIKNTSGNGCVQVRNDFDKWLCKKIRQIVMNISVCK